jgi:hypothetical protein
MSITHSLKSCCCASILATLTLSACGVASGPTTTEQRNVDNFHSVDLRGSATMDILVGPTASLSLVGNAQVLSGIKTRVQEGMLIIENERRWFWQGGSGRTEIRLTTPTLNSVALNGAGNISINGVNGDALALVVQGAGNLEASGKVETLTARTNGAGNMDLARLVAGAATVSLNGAGNMDVNATKSLDATVNGVGSIDYLGKPQDVKTSINGVGSISPK